MNGFLLTTFKKRRQGEGVTPPPPPINPLFTPLGLTHTAEELQVWRERLLDNESYRGDKARIINLANQLVSNPLMGRYTGPTKTKDGVTLGPNDPIPQHAQPESGHKSIYITCAAFLGMLGNKVNGVWQPDMNYVNAAKIAILDAYAQSGLDFSNTKRWKEGELIDINPSFTTAEYLSAILIAFTYIENHFSQAQKTNIKAWLNIAAEWFTLDLGNATNKRGINTVFVDRWNGNYNFEPSYGAGEHQNERTHDNGYIVSKPQKIYNNRRAAQERFIAYNGFLNNNATHKKHARLFVEETLKYGTYGNGFFSDMERAWKYIDHEEGLGYSMSMLTILLDICDLFARHGDDSLYKYETKIGAFGTEGIKSMKRSVDVYTKIFAKTVTYTIKGQLIDGVSSDFVSAQDAFLSKYNLWFKDPFITQTYRRQLQGQNPVPSSPSGNGSIPTYMGPGGLFPGYIFMYDGVNVNPYPKKNFFNVVSASSTSAGVYKKDGVTKVRSLWEGEIKQAGQHAAFWDGKDDNGTLLPNGDYEIKGIAHNVTAEYQEKIGNTSTFPSGETVHRSFQRPYDMCITGNFAYVATGYEEGKQSSIKFALNDPQKRINVLPHINGETSQECKAVCTDGVRVYWGGIDPLVPNNAPRTEHQKRSFVFATNVSNDAQVSFSAGQSLAMTHGGRTYTSVINLVDVDYAYITSIAVQRTGLHLFVARNGLNRIDVLNKTTGAFVRSLTVTGVKYIACDIDNLWINVGTEVTKYNVNEDGTITDAGVTISGFTSPQCLYVNQEGSIIVIHDGLTSGQRKAYSTSNGGVLWAHGNLGGYTNSVNVTNDKFYFSDEDKISQSGGAFEADGSTWVIDGGNYRILKYSPSRAYQTTVMWLPHIWSSSVMKANPYRVFADYLEFHITSYSTPIQSSWTLARNWGYKVPATKDSEFSRLKFVTEIDGFTYACGTNSGNWELLELTSTGIRFTGINIGLNYLTQMYPDGTVYGYDNMTGNGVGQTVTIWKKPCTGRDGSNNLTWGAKQTIATIPNAQRNDPYYKGVQEMVFTAGEITSSGYLITYDGNGKPHGAQEGGYHLGAIKVGDNKFTWKHLPSTFLTYSGEYPLDYFDIGNHALEENGNPKGYTGAKAQVVGNVILVGDRSEFWKNGQTNKYTLFTDKGLLISQFGNTTWDIELGGSAYGAAGMAGNAFAHSFIKVGNDYYLWHNDESFGGGVHRWKINGLDSIQEFTIPYTLTGPVAVPADGIDLTEGLGIRDSVLVDGVAGWTRNPTGEVNNGFNDVWNVRTQKKRYKDIDVYAKFASTTAKTNTVSRDLGNHNVNSWTFKGSISFEDFEQMGNNEPGNGCYLEILDDTGKVIVRFYHAVVFNPTVHTIYANGVTVATGTTHQIKPVIHRHKPLEFKVDSSGVKVVYAHYSPITVPILDSTANRSKPKTLRLSFFHASGTSYQRHMSILGKLYV